MASDIGEKVAAMKANTRIRPHYHYSGDEQGVGRGRPCTRAACPNWLEPAEPEICYELGLAAAAADLMAAQKELERRNTVEAEYLRLTDGQMENAERLHDDLRGQLNAAQEELAEARKALLSCAEYLNGASAQLEKTMPSLASALHDCAGFARALGARP